MNKIINDTLLMILKVDNDNWKVKKLIKKGKNEIHKTSRPQSPYM